MQFVEMLNAGAKKAGSKSALGLALGVHEANMRNAWKGRPITPKACAKLAEFIGVDLGRVIAAQEEFRAETEEERSFWHRFSQAAAIAALSACGTLFVSAPSDAIAAPEALGGANTPTTHY